MRPPEIGQHGQAEPHLGPPAQTSSGTCEPREEVEAGQAAQAESGRGLPGPKVRSCCSGRGGRGWGCVAPSLARLTLADPQVSLRA